MNLERARTLADAVLLEGYALYPYRASAPKNRFRWTFGVLAPRAWSEAGGCEPWWLETQLLVAGAPSRIAGQLRFFQVERRRADGAAPWDEGVVQAIDFEVPGERAAAVAATESAETVIPFALAASRVAEPAPGAHAIRDRHAVAGCVRVRCERVLADRPLRRLTIRVENTTPWADPSASREEAVRAALASTHLLVGVDGGELLSAIDPPGWAREAAAACANVATYPVLAGPPGTSDLVLCAPFILYDHPQVAPESAGDLCDATEIDELLVLRTRALTDDEKRQARATDRRAAQIIDRAESLPDEQLARMHGASRALLDGEMVPHPDTPPVGAKVRLRASTRRTDAQDLLYVGHVATVKGVRQDVDGTMFLALTIDDDPAAELHDWYGRYHHYRLDEVDVL